MNMIPVSSSNISSIGYDGTNLYVLFNSGGLYEYFNVPAIHLQRIDVRFLSRQLPG